MSESEVLEKTLRKFIDKGGYKLVECMEWKNDLSPSKAREQGKNPKRVCHCERWRGITKATRKTGLSYMTIRNIIDTNPERPREKKYVEEFEDTEGLKLYRQASRAGWLGRGKPISKSTMHSQENYFLMAFKYCNHRDPNFWDEPISIEGKDYETCYAALWSNNGRNVTRSPDSDLTFYDKVADGFNIKVANAMHNMMKACGHDPILLKKFKGVQRKQPKLRAHLYFTEAHLESVIPNIQNNDLLMALMLGMVKGARFSGLNVSKPQDYYVDEDGDVWSKDLEPKLLRLGQAKPYVERIIPKRCYQLLQRYIEDYNIQSDQSLFPRSDSTYRSELKRCCKKGSKALKQLASSKGFGLHSLKRTYINQAVRHGVSAETIVEQTGTQLRTLEEYYIKKHVKKIKKEMLGKEYEYVPFPQWVNDIMILFERQYAENLGLGDGAREGFEHG